MGILTRLRGDSGIRAEGRPPAHSDYWYDGSAAAAVSTAGVAVSPDIALQNSTVYACVKVLAETLASLPLITYERLADGDKARATSNPLYSLLHDAPNQWQTSFEFREMMMGHLVLRGNAYAQIVPGPRGPVDQLIPLHPDRVKVERLPSGALRYTVTRPNGTSYNLLQDEMFHLRGWSADGITGMSVISMARNGIGLALAAESYGARVFSQDASPTGVLQHPGTLGDTAAKHIEDSFNRRAGLGNAHRAMVLEEGMTWQKMGMTSEDAQYLESRAFSVVEMCRWFRMQPHMIQHLANATFSNIEHQSLEFVMFTMLPWFRRWEQAISRDLIIATGRYFAEFLVDALLRGDIKSRYEAYAIGRNWGWLSPNDVRRLENMNRIDGDGGDVYLRPLNMVDVNAPEPLPAATAAPQPAIAATVAPLALPAPTLAGATPDVLRQARMIAEEAAMRLVRKEITAATKAARRCSSDHAGWTAWASEFYGEHVGDLRRSLRLTEEQAQGYCDAQRDALVWHGVRVAETWEAEKPALLAGLALGGV